MASSKKKLPPVHPGEALQEIMNEAGLSANALALALRVPGNRITAILNRQRGITAETALRLGRYFGTSAYAICRRRSGRCTAYRRPWCSASCGGARIRRRRG
jgi:addiction module HigA family antidote